MPTFSVETHHDEEVERVLHDAGADHLRARRRGDKLTIESGSTGAAVSHAMLQRVHADRTVPPERVAIAERQFSTRLSRFREAIRDRGAGPLAGRLAQTLLTVAGGVPGAPAAPADATATTLVEGYWAAAQAELRERFGAARLPEHVRPSEAAGGPRGRAAQG